MKFKTFADELMRATLNDHHHSKQIHFTVPLQSIFYFFTRGQRLGLYLKALISGGSGTT
jgi:hypothetical protein